jgi:MFS family permease
VLRLGPLRGLLAERDYVIYLSGNAVALTGTWIQRITLAWLVWELTRSPFWVGAAALADLAATLTAGLAGGPLADRFDRLRFIFWFQLLSCAITLGLAGVYFAGAADLWVLIAFRFFLSASIAMVQPARMALIPELVGLANVNAAISLGAVVFSVARALGPALAGALIAAGGFGLALLANSLTFVIMAITLVVLMRRRSRFVAGAGAGTLLGQIVEGYRHVTHDFAFRTLFVLYCFFVLTIRAVEELLPAFAEIAFSRGVDGMAMLTTALGVGSIVGGLIAAGRPLEALARSLFVTGLAYAASVAAFVATDRLELGLALIAMTGLFTVQFGTAAQALIQAQVVPEMRGRVMSLWFVTMRGGPALGALFMGGLAELVGLARAFTFGAVLCAAATLYLLPTRNRLGSRLNGSSYGGEDR